MVLKLALILGAVALATAYPVTYEEQQQPQQQRLQAGPLQPQYRYVQQPQPAPVQYQQPQYQQPQYQQAQYQPQQDAAPVYQQQALPQQAVYRQPAAQPQRPRKLRPVASQQQLKAFTSDTPEDPDFDANPAPYQFSFDVRDDLNTNYQNRKEQREGDKITGSYSVVDSDGFIRTVKYTADPIEGFKAEVTREPTDIKVVIPTQPPSAAAPLTHRQQQTQQYLEAAPQFQAPQAYAAPQQYVRRPAAARAPARQQYAEQPEAQQQYRAASVAQPVQYVAPVNAQRAKTAYLTPQQAAQYQYAQQ